MFWVNIRARNFLLSYLLHYLNIGRYLWASLFSFQAVAVVAVLGMDHLIENTI